MLEYLRRASAPTDLIGVIAEVRRRWRLKLAIRGAVRVLGIWLAFFLVAALLMEWARFNPLSIVLSRVLLVVTLLTSVFWFLVRPLRRRVTDEQVALYLEEHEPRLQATLLSAVESSRAGHVPESTALVRRVIEQALETCANLDATKKVERTPLQRNGVALGAIAAVALLALFVGPAFIRDAVSAMLKWSESVQAASPYRIEVTPGDATVPKGADQSIKASLVGFASEDVVLMVRRSPTSEFEPLPLVRNDDGKYEGMLFDIAAAVEYQVIADGVQSARHTLKVVDVPYVQRMEMEYRFPAYTGLEPQKLEDGGDIAVLRGTDVFLRIFPTMKTSGGRIALNDKESVELAPQADGSLTASFKVVHDGSYQVELKAPSGELVIGSPEYTIDVLEDRAPTVSFNRPGRDTSVSSIEEVFVEAAAEDDFGVRNLELVYSVNGGAEKVVKLFNGTSRLPEVNAGHTFYLEELGVQTGDSVSYYARAADNDGNGAKTATSNLYFLRIRPFKKDFKEAQSQGGGGGGGGGGGAGQVEALSEQQRQIISATFNVQRDRRGLTPAKLRENSTVVSLSQGRLREQVEGLLTRMNSQLVERDPAFAKIAELLPQAVAAMKEAEGKLSAAAPDQALAPENKALQVLQKAEEEYETQISVNQQQGGGGGGGGGAMQQELAELFEQELDKMANRYETANQASEQQNDREVDELLEKLKELARRQEQEAERQRRRALQSGGGGGGGSAQQRALADQVEEAARRLERLAREEQRPELQESARQLREAADAMRRAAAGGGDAGASAQAQAALERLRETEKRLQRSLTQRAERDIEDARRDAEEIARQQQEIADQVRSLPANASGRTQQARQINEKKDQLEEKLGKLEADLDDAARDASREERPASRKMAEAAGAIRDNRLRDAVRYSKALVSRGSNQQANAAESDISRGIEELRQRLNEAQAALGQGTPGDRREEALRKAQRLARAAESLQERTRERATQGNRDQNGQGQDGQQGQGQGKGEGQGQGQGQGEGQGQGQGQGRGQGQDGGQQAGEGGGQRGDGRDGGRFAAGGVDRGGAWRGGANWGGWWEGGPVRLTPEDIRQLRGEVRQYAGEAQDLRRMLQGEDIDPRELDEIVNALRQLQDDRIYQNVEELARLQAFVADSLKRFEFGLRRQVDTNTGAVVLSGSDEVPEEFRKLVEQYYRSLGQAPR